MAQLVARVLWEHEVEGSSPFTPTSFYSKMLMNLLIDFDSTIVGVESLDELARIALISSPDRSAKLQEIASLTADGMAGKIPFSESLSKRLALFSANKSHLNELVAILEQELTLSFKERLKDLNDIASEIYIVSGGFTDYIAPVLLEYGIESDHILANNFTFDKNGCVTGCVTTNPLASNGGKVLAVRKLELKGSVVMVGDGITDLQVAQAGLANSFIAYVEHANRPEVAGLGDRVAKDFGEVVEHLLQFDSYAGVA